MRELRHESSEQEYLFRPLRNSVQSVLSDVAVVSVGSAESPKRWVSQSPLPQRGGSQTVA